MGGIVVIGAYLHGQAMPALNHAPGSSVEITTEVPGANVLFLVAGTVSAGLKTFLHTGLTYKTRVQYLDDGDDDGGHRDRMRGARARGQWCAHACGSPACTVACETAAASTTTPPTTTAAWWHDDAEPSYCEMFLADHAKAVRKQRFQSELDTVGGAACQVCAKKHMTRAEQLLCVAPRAFHGAFPAAQSDQQRT